MLTDAMIKAVFPRHPRPEALRAALNAKLPAYGINSRLRVAGFLAQAGHESAGFSRFEENLNYSADGLLKTFPKYFTAAQAKAYARQPQKIAARAYANRMGNGPEASGDGWTYRGRGPFQLTGKANYQAWADALGITLPAAMEYILTLEGGIESAGWFWVTRKLNAAADKDDITSMTRIVNGGTNGLVERGALYAKAKAAIPADYGR
jgi:putative chitinase